MRAEGLGTRGDREGARLSRIEPYREARTRHAATAVVGLSTAGRLYVEEARRQLEAHASVQPIGTRAHGPAWPAFKPKPWHCVRRSAATRAPLDAATATVRNARWRKVICDSLETQSPETKQPA